MDGNGKVDISDALMIAKYDVGLISGFVKKKVYDGTETTFSLKRGGADQFLLPVEIGDQTFDLLVDTGSDGLLVFEDKTDTSDKGISVSDTKVSKTYASGTRSGVVATASVRIGAYSAPRMQIMLVQKPDSRNDPSLTPKGADGIIGLRRTAGLDFSLQGDSLDAPLNALTPSVEQIEFDFPPTGTASLSFGKMPVLDSAETQFVFRAKALSVADPSDRESYSDLQVPFRAKTSFGEADDENLDILLDTGAVSKLVLDTKVAEKLGYNISTGKWNIPEDEEIELNLIGLTETATLYPKFKVWEVSVAPYSTMGVEFEAVMGISRWQEYVVGFDYVPTHKGGPDGTISLLRRLDMNEAVSGGAPFLSAEFIPLPGLNSVGSDEFPRADDSGSTVVFQSDREGGMGGYDIYVWQSGQGIMEMPNLNSAGNDTYPSVSGNGQLVAFQSDRDGSGDIYLYDIANKAFADVAGINSDAHDMSPSLSSDGRYIAFASGRSGGSGGSDIYLYDRTAEQMIPCRV